MRPIPPIWCFVWVCAVHEQRACIRAHPPSPPPLIPLVSLWLSPASNARIYCVEGMISTCDLSTVSPRCHSISLLHLSFLFIRSFSHQPSNGKIIPQPRHPRRRRRRRFESAHCTATTTPPPLPATTTMEKSSCQKKTVLSSIAISV